MPDQMLDAAGHPDPYVAAQRGYRSVAGYLYNLTRGYIDGAHMAGLDILLIGETSANRPLFGQPAGAQDGYNRTLEAERLGAPHSAAIFYTADCNVDPHSFPTVGGYLEGVRMNTLYRVGLYGGGDLVDWALANGLCDYGWETGATSWSSHPYYHATSLGHLRQLAPQVTINGTTCDVNNILKPDYGQWYADASRHANPGPVPTTPAPDHLSTIPTREDPMAAPGIIYTIATDTSGAQYIIDPYARTVNNLSGDEAVMLVQQGWQYMEVPAGHEVHRLINEAYTPGPALRSA